MICIKDPIYIILLIVCFACENKDIQNDDTRLGSKVMIIGHMGMGVYYSWPGNSLESLRTTLDIGCDGTEMDVQITADSILVAYHDGDLSSQTNCDGKIHEMTWDQISNCRYDQNINSSKLIRLEDLFSSIQNIENYYFSLDCKVDAPMADPVPYKLRFLRAIQRICIKYNIEKNVFIEGPKNFLMLTKQMNLKNPLFLLTIHEDSPADTALSHNLFGISIPYQQGVELFEHSSLLHIRTMVWAPSNYYQNKSALEKKPDIIQTDDPISLLKLTNRFNYESVRP
ncbi:MAG TPA: glycerophosphodiester phosphodiesterase family protein [Bacteroidia bacterium]